MDTTQLAKQNRKLCDMEISRQDIGNKFYRPGPSVKYHLGTYFYYYFFFLEYIGYSVKIHLFKKIVEI